MDNKIKFLILALFAIEMVLLFILFLTGNNVAVLNPKGIVAQEEKNLIITATLLMLIFVIPVIVLTFFTAWKYRASNKKAKYTPDWDNHNGLQLTWWAALAAIILVLAVITWKTTHKLDPYKPLASNTKSIAIQVVALRWKWLFIYPEQNIATVNFVAFPEKTPIAFELTSDAPMNSFWIPQLGGQMYAMEGMKTHLHLMADETGEFQGSSAEISGAGFAGMTFIAKSTTQEDFDTWVKLVKQSGNSLDMSEYNKLSQPSEHSPSAFYTSVEKDLYNAIIMKYMTPSPSGSQYHQENDIQNESTKYESKVMDH